jgi:hypothetical protein
MVLFWGMYELEVEQQDPQNPTIHCGIWLDVRVVQHPSDILCIHFNGEGGQPNEMETIRT